MRPEEHDFTPMTGLVVRRDVRGAPLQLEVRVLIAPALDDTGDARFAGRVGVVSGYVYDSPEEQYPHRPLVLVSVEGLGEELFFPDELSIPRARRSSRSARTLAVS